MKRYSAVIAAAYVAGILSLTACTGYEDETGTTGAEERQLDDAAAAFDAAQIEYEAAIQIAEPRPSAAADEEH